ncbi:hypothetical protein VTK26DRAFT_9440 [Humicola hyalothermophila]
MHLVTNTTGQESRAPSLSCHITFSPPQHHQSNKPQSPHQHHHHRHRSHRTHPFLAPPEPRIRSVIEVPRAPHLPCPPPHQLTLIRRLPAVAAPLNPLGTATAASHSACSPGLGRQPAHVDQELRVLVAEWRDAGRRVRAEAIVLDDAVLCRRPDRSRLAFWPGLSSTSRRRQGGGIWRDHGASRKFNRQVDVGTKIAKLTTCDLVQKGLGKTKKNFFFLLPSGRAQAR